MRLVATFIGPGCPASGAEPGRPLGGGGPGPPAALQVRLRHGPEGVLRVHRLPYHPALHRAGALAGAGVPCLHSSPALQKCRQRRRCFSPFGRPLFIFYVRVCLYIDGLGLCKLACPDGPIRATHIFLCAGSQVSPNPARPHKVRVTQSRVCPTFPVLVPPKVPADRSEIFDLSWSTSLQFRNFRPFGNSIWTVEEEIQCIFHGLRAGHFPLSDCAAS